MLELFEKTKVMLNLSENTRTYYIDVINSAKEIDTRFFRTLEIGTLNYNIPSKPLNTKPLKMTKDEFIENLVRLSFNVPDDTEVNVFEDFIEYWDQTENYGDGLWVDYEYDELFQIISSNSEG